MSLESDLIWKNSRIPKLEATYKRLTKLFNEPPLYINYYQHSFFFQGFVIFGQNLAKIPCLRNSFLYGIGGGFAAGLGTFMFTSRVKRACDLGMAAFCLVTMGYWVQCRYTFSKNKFEMRRVQELLRRQTMYEGTEHEAELNRRLDLEAKEA